MEAATLARPYARAAFELASAQRTLDAWSTQLAAAAAVATDPRVLALGNSPKVGALELARLHRPEGVADDAPLARFLAALAENRRLPLLPQVASQFEALRRAAERSVKVRLRFAEQPDAEHVERLLAALRQRLDREVEAEVTVTPEILGGAIIDVDGEVIDGSVRGQLRQLEAALTH